MMEREYTMAWVFLVLLSMFFALDLWGELAHVFPTFSDLVGIWGHRWPVLKALYVFGAVVLYNHFWGK